ncbi:MAG: von Willebrand factor type A domain-containing protein [Pseudomonadota bacterium]
MSRHPSFLALSLVTLLSACAHKEAAIEEAYLDLDGDDARVHADAPTGSVALIPEVAEPSGAVSATPPSPEPTAAPAHATQATPVLLDSLASDDADYELVEVASAAPKRAQRAPSPPADQGAVLTRAASSSRSAPRERKAELASAASGASAYSAGGGGYYAPPEEPAPAPDVVVPSGTEDYTDYGVNPFTIVTQDALSTFSIDVDTASYTMARRKLGEGTLPPEAAVRVEEFVNFFDYDYAQPKDGPFAVHMEAMPDPFRPGHHLLRVGVQGDELSRSERPALHLVFLADVSGSMSSGDKLPLAKEAMHMLVDSLREDDTVGLCTYAGRVAAILQPTSAANKRAIHDAINSLESGGSTAMSAGIDIAYEMAWSTFKEGEENRVIVMSDGDANVGNTSWEVMLANIKGYADKGVTLSTIGFGMGNYKDTLMEQLSNKGDGNNYYVDSREQAQRLFVEDLGGTMLTIARDVKIQVEFNPQSVYSYRLIGYENRDIADKDFRNDRVDAGEVGSGTNVTALYDVILRDGYTRELATVRMRWEAPGADKAATERAFRFDHTALKETSYLTSRATRIAYSAATFAEILRHSPHAAEISLERLAQFATQAARPGDKDDMELVELIRKADALGVQNVATR